MLHLLEIPTDYWARFINVETTDTDSQKVSGYSYFGKFVTTVSIDSALLNLFWIFTDFFTDLIRH